MVDAIIGALGLFFMRYFPKSKHADQLLTDLKVLVWDDPVLLRRQRRDQEVYSC